VTGEDQGIETLKGRGGCLSGLNEVGYTRERGRERETLVHLNWGSVGK